MCRVRVFLLSPLRDIVGGGEVEVELHEPSVGALIRMMVERYGDRFKEAIINLATGSLLPYITIMVNGHDIEFLDKIDTGLKDGDEVLILPPLAGG